MLLVLPLSMSGQLVRNLPPSKCVNMSTSGAVHGDMGGWIVTDEGDRWSGKLDVRGPGRHLDTTFRGWSATLAKTGPAGHCLGWCYSLFYRWIFMVGSRVARTMFIPGALHGVEGFLPCRCERAQTSHRCVPS